MADLISHYEQATLWIIRLCPARDKFAHVCAGLAIWLISAVVLKKGLASRTPIVVIITLELLNEITDRIAHGSWDWHDTTGDMAATWFWPIVIGAALNFFPSLVERQSASR